jgi:hypothetical protein
MPKGRRDEQERTGPRSYVYWVSGEKEERRNDLVGPESGGSGGGEQEEASSGARVLSLSGSSMFKHGKEKEKGSWVLGNDGFPVSLGKRFWGRSKRFGIREVGDDEK